MKRFAYLILMKLKISIQFSLANVLEEMQYRRLDLLFVNGLPPYLLN